MNIETDPNAMTEPPSGAGVTTGWSVARTEREKRRAIIATLHAAHLRYDEIASQLGVSHGTVASDVQVIRKRWRERAEQTYDTFVAEETAKLDELERRVLPKALTGDGKGPSLWAVDRVLAIHDRRCRLQGVESKVKVSGRLEVMAESPVDRDIRMLIEQMQGTSTVDAESSQPA